MVLYKPTKPVGYTDKYSNGCGPGSWKVDIIPDHLWWMSIKEECDIHDFMYEVGITLADKEEADRTFRNNVVRKILSQTGWINRILRRRRLRLAQVYYLAVEQFGGAAYWEGKNG